MKKFDANLILPYIRKPKDYGDTVTHETNYYLELFENNLTKNKYIKWNWCAALFYPFWLVYRRMYAYAFVSFLLWFIIEGTMGYLIKSFPKVFIVGLVASLAGFIFFGFFGNLLYLEHIKNKIGKETPPEFGVDSSFVWMLFIVPLVVYSKAH